MRFAIASVLSLLIAPSAFAQAYDPSYAVEINRGALVVPTRILGIGGAYVSIAEGAGAYDMNPASAAIRSRHNKDELWDWDFALEAVLTPRDSHDVENNQRDVDADVNSVLASIGFVAEEFGFGLSIVGTSMTLNEEQASGVTDLSAGTFTAAAGYNLMDGQLVMGGGLVIGYGQADVDGVRLMNLVGLGLTAGGVVMPKGQPYRFGFSLRSRMRMRPDDESSSAGEIVGGIVTPPSMILPAQFRIGGSYSVGPRANNVTATFGKREASKEDALPKSREYATISVDFVFTERLEQAAGFQAWADNELQIAGTELSFGFHAGIEGELIDGILKGRLGGYFEPSRFENVGRIHGTAGFDLFLFQLYWDWKAAAAIDLARNYSNIVLSIGFWH